MANAISSWYTWLTELRIIPQEYQYITSVISSFFITLALAPIIPIILLFVYDVILWFWRLAAANWQLRLSRRTGAAMPTPPSH
ncbi:hypothetical protein VTI28DRAFT_2593 [Corynascus sepedonium]